MRSAAPARTLAHAEANPAGVAVGELWADNNPRWHGGRSVRVVAVAGAYATVEVVRGSLVGRRSRVRLDRFRPNHTGYRRLS